MELLQVATLVCQATEPSVCRAALFFTPYGEAKVRKMQVWMAVFAVAAGAGCYHATIETGLTPSTITVSHEWASGWIYGLVPPGTVETMAKCPGGVAKVETQLSLPNMLVGWLTIGIYTPMSIVATCAASGHASLAPTPTPSIKVAESAGDAAIRAAFSAAADQAVSSKAPVIVEVDAGR